MKLERAALAAAMIAGVLGGVPIGISNRARNRSDETRDGVRFGMPPRYETADPTINTLAGALSITDARADAPGPKQQGATAIAGLLPPGALALTHAEPVPGVLPSGAPQLVELGPEVAVRVRGSATAENGSRWQVTVYIVATEGGDVALACASQAVAEDETCERIATTLEIPGSLGALPERKTLREYRERVRPMVSRDERRAAELRRELRRAHTREGQARKAEKLATASERTSTSLGALPPNSLARTAQRGLRAALIAQRRAYMSLARGADRGNRLAYNSARRSVEVANRDVLAHERQVWSIAELDAD